MKIIIDSREKAPYEFPGHDVEVSGLDVGDYSLHGLTDQIAIERKSIDDLAGSMTSGRSRFERELFKGKALSYFCIVAECSLSDLAEGKYRSKLAPKAAVQSLLSFSIKYQLPIFFCESRGYGQRVTESLLSKFAAEIQKRYEVLE